MIDLVESKQTLKKAMNIPDEGIAPLPLDWWERRSYKDWKDELFNRALFPLDPRIVALPYGGKYGDDNRMLQDLLYPDRIKPDWELAKKLIRENAPKHLYKFRTVSSHSLQNLRDGTFWLCRAGNFNDPFDCAIVEPVYGAEDYASFFALAEELGIQSMSQNYELGKIDREIYERFEKHRFLTTDAGMELLRQIYEIKTNYWRRRGWIGSLSEANDSILMWSYYADSHKGFCIEYDTLEIYESPNVRHNMYPMNYADPENGWSDSATGLDWLPLYITLRKSSQWKQEKEWRIAFPERVVEGDGNEEGWNLKMPTPTAVYLGGSMDANERKNVIEICQERGIKTYTEKFNYWNMTVDFREDSAT
jgi:hypothetical protein